MTMTTDHDSSPHNPPDGPDPIRPLERTVVAFAVAILAIAAVALIPDPTRRGLHQSDFDRLRTTWQCCADVVLLGDSRVLCGVSPAQMQTRLKNRRIYNLAFAGTGHSDRTFELAKSVLDPGSPRPAIVLGITAISLNRGQLGVAKFEDVQETAQNVSLVDRTLDYISRPFERRSFKSLSVGLGMQGDKYSFKHYHEDGWLETDSQPNKPSRELPRYRVSFQVTPVPYDESMAMIVRNVKRWTGQGIRVYGFRPPTVQGMIDLENTAGGYNEAKIRKLFTEAGGIWLDVDQKAYPTYDGSHLRYDGAKQFSRDLAELIRKSEERENPASENPAGAMLLRRDPSRVETEKHVLSQGAK